MSDSSRLVQQFFIDAFSQGQLEVLDRILAAGFVDHNAPPGIPPGPGGIKMVLGGFRAGMPDVSFVIEDTISEGDRIAVRYTASGTHTGEYFGIPATGRAVSFTGITLFRVADGLLQESWVQYDAFGLMRQLGVVPG